MVSDGPRVVTATASLTSTLCGVSLQVIDVYWACRLAGSAADGSDDIDAFCLNRSVTVLSAGHGATGAQDAVAKGDNGDVAKDDADDSRRSESAGGQEGKSNRVNVGQAHDATCGNGFFSVFALEHASQESALRVFVPGVSTQTLLPSHVIIIFK